MFVHKPTAGVPERVLEVHVLKERKHRVFVAVVQLREKNVVEEISGKILNEKKRRIDIGNLVGPHTLLAQFPLVFEAIV